LVIHERGGDCAPANFSGRGGWDAIHQIDLRWTFVFCQQLAAVLDECRLGSAMAFMQDHRGSHFFAQRGMRAAKRDRRRDCGMPQQNLIDFVRRDVLASADDDVLDPARQMQIAVFVKQSFVARAKPSMHKSASVGLGIVFVSTKYVGSLNDDFAPLVGAEVIAVLVHDADAQSSGYADRTCFPVSRG